MFTLVCMAVAGLTGMVLGIILADVCDRIQDRAIERKRGKEVRS